jgi:hypothetical protein
VDRNDFQLHVAAAHGKPQRVVVLEHVSAGDFRDNMNPASAQSRERFVQRAAERFKCDMQSLNWLHTELTQKADAADAAAAARRAEHCDDDQDDDEKKSQSTMLVDLAEGIELFHDAGGESYGRFRVDDHYEVAYVRNKQFKRYLLRLYYLETGKTPSSQAMQDALGVIEGKALFDGDEREVHVRVAVHDGCIYIDLANDLWQVVELSASGWKVLDESPVMFRRAKAMLPLPVPVMGGDIAELRQFVNVTDDDWPLILAWLVAALRGKGPFPILAVHGEQGSAKSTLCRFLRALIDPNTAALRCEPRESRDLMIQANNGLAIVLDNLSHIRTWLSDALCRLSTGGGFSTRMLYENDEEMIFEAQRPVILNGIEEVATRSDLLDRCLLLNLLQIPDERRQPESELVAAFEIARPGIFGALLTAVSVALRRLSMVKLANPPRMADFAVWATAAEPGLGLEEGAFEAAYMANREAGNDLALEASPVGKAITELVEAEGGAWRGTATELLEKLNLQANETIKRLEAWPKSAPSLGGAVKRLAPNLRKAGIEVEQGHGSGKKRPRSIAFWKIEPGGNSLSAPSAPSAQLVFEDDQQPSADRADKADRTSPEQSDPSRAEHAAEAGREVFRI